MVTEPCSQVTISFVRLDSLVVRHGPINTLFIFKGHENRAWGCEVLKIIVYELVYFRIAFLHIVPLFTFYDLASLSK